MNQSSDLLSQTNFDSAPYFNFKGVECHAKVVDIYDGDTCTVIFYYKDELCKYRCRLLGINSCELKPPLSALDRDQVIQKACQSRDRFIGLILKSNNFQYSNHATLREYLSQNRYLNYVVMDDFDKYGRILINIYPTSDKSEQSINQILLAEGLADSYMI